MGDWANLPMDLLSILYTYLPRRDRLSCSLVCRRWQDGLDHVMLWKTMVVHMDRDLMEPSTILLVRDYCKYIKNLEFGWAVTHRNHRWAQGKYKDLTKRAVRFLLILCDNYIQLDCLRIFNWFDFTSFQKVTYHLCRFLKNQMGLEKIIFDNLNMHSKNFTRLLTSCLGSGTAITSLDIRSCYFCQIAFDSVYFRSCMEQLSSLKAFKVDYYVLSCNLIDAILTSRNRYLENLEIILKETTWHDQIIDDEQWCLLCSACPKLKVTLIIRNIYHYGELRLYLKQYMPIVSLSLVLPRFLDIGGRCNFRKILNLLVTNYNKTLETLDLHIKNEREVIDDMLLMVIRRCSHMKSFVFNGYLEDPQILKDTFTDINYLCLASNGVHLVFDKIVRDEINAMKHKHVQLSWLKRNSNLICSLLIIN